MLLLLFNQIFDIAHRIPSRRSNSISDIEHIEFHLEDRECARIEFDVQDLFQDDFSGVFALCVILDLNLLNN